MRNLQTTIFIPGDSFFLFFVDLTHFVFRFTEYAVSDCTAGRSQTKMVQTESLFTKKIAV